MEVGEQTADDSEFVSRTEKDAGLARVSCYRFALRKFSTVFQCASGGCAGGYDAISALQRSVYGFGGGGGEGVAFGMEVDIFQIFRTNRLKGAKAHVESDGLDLDAVLFELGQYFGGEVKTGSGRSGAAGLLGEDGLVAVAVL